MLKKLLGMGRASPDRSRARASTDDSASSRDRASDAAQNARPPRPWLSISWHISDPASSQRVRRLAEDLADRARDPSTIFSDFGACDAGLVTLLVRKDAQGDGVATLVGEAERIMRRILLEAEPVLHPTEHLCVACPCEDGANQQIVAMLSPVSRTLMIERIIVRGEEVIGREPLTLVAAPSAHPSDAARA